LLFASILGNSEYISDSLASGKSNGVTFEKLASLRMEDSVAISIFVYCPRGVPGTLTHAWSIGFVGEVVANTLLVRAIF
jgi:hypothetical protein